MSIATTGPDVTTGQPPRTPNQREAQTLSFFAKWGESFDSFCNSFDQLQADDCVWDQRPIPKLTGPRSAVRFLKLTRKTLGLMTCDVEIVHIASDGDVVHVERVDRLRRADGSLIAAAAVAGVLTFSGDRVVHWREYFDSTGFVVQALGTSVLYLARRAATVARGPRQATSR